MLTLGIETSCDETALAVLSGKRVLSNVIASSMHLHKKYGGIVPELATRHHVEVISYCYKQALKEAKIKQGDLDLISVTEGPGLIGALMVGIAFAKALSLSLNIPLIGTNHVIAHLWSGFLINKTLKFPFLGLVVSGGHTGIILVKGVNRYQLLGQTQDDAAGEAFDKVAKILKLGYPGGPIIEEKANGIEREKRVKFTIPSSFSTDFDFSFSGIKTAVLYYVNKKGGPDNIVPKEVSSIASGFQEAVCDCLARKSIAACTKKGIERLVIGGGVTANNRLRERLEEEASARGIKVFMPPIKLCLDNAAMVASVGADLFKKGIRSNEHISGYANFN